MASVGDSAVAFFSLTPLWELHHAQLIELTQRLQKNRTHITIFHCDSVISSCRANPNNSNTLCNQCVLQSKYSIKNFFPFGVRHEWIQSNELRDYSLKLSGEINNQSDLINFSPFGFPFGRAVLSQLQTMRKETNIPESILNHLAPKFLENALSLYEYFGERFRNEEFSEAFVFGGRYYAERAFLFAAKENGVSTCTFETGATIQRVWLTNLEENNFACYQSDIAQIKDKVKLGKLDKQEVYSVGGKYFENWYLGKSADPKFLNPNVNFLHSISNTNVINLDNFIVVFPSSNYEVISFDDFEILKDPGLTQFDVLAKLHEDIDKLGGKKVVVRWHPNIVNSGLGDREAVDKFITNTPLFIHIRYDDTVDSYSLISGALAVISFGSTIGIEAAYRNKPSLLLANSSYSELRACISPANYLDLLRIIREEDWKIDENDSRYWGFWRATFGSPMSFVDFSKGAFTSQGRKILSTSLRARRKIGFLKHSIKTLCKGDS